MKHVGFVVPVALGFAIIGGDASAQTHNSCGIRDVIIERLSAKYGEKLAGGGLQSSTRLLEVWAADETGTWTVLATNAHGQTCVIASGTNWHDTPILEPVGEPS